MDGLFVAWQLTALASGLLSIAAMIYFFVKYPSTRVHPGKLLLCIFLSVTISSIARVALHAWYIVLDPYEYRGAIPATLSTVANKELGHHASTRERYVPFFFWCYLFFSTSGTLWFLMLAMNLIFSLSNPFLPFNADNVVHHIYAWPVSILYCLVFRYILGNFQSDVTANAILYFDLPDYLVFIYIAGALIQAWRRSRILETHAHATTRRMAKRILPYLGVFALHTLASMTIYIVQLKTAYDSMTTNAVDQLSLVLESLALFALFCYDAGVFRAVSSWAADDGSSIDPSRTTQIQAGGSTLMSTAGGRAPNGNNREKIDVSNKLRMDIMRYMSMGIMKSIENADAIEKAAVGSVSGEFTGSDTEAAAIDIGDGYSTISYNDYNHVESMGVVVYGLKDYSMLNFKDCAPKIFHRIRAQFNIDQDFYRESFDPTKILSEHGSEGKSGNIFYFTANKQFMVKSVPKKEFDTLRTILPHYHEYLQSNPQSMLCRYFGCHSISLPIGKRRMYFVVMHNLFNEGPVDQRYDLKGNRDRRQAVSAADIESLVQVAKEKKPISQLLMDIDFLKISTGISLSSTNTNLQQDQLCSDFVFLASRGIIDYSILLGVRYDDPENRETLQGGLSSHDQKELYYVGIVDMLQRYNWRWTVQRWFLGLLLCKDTHDVSAVPPDEYATRLSDFVREKLFDVSMSSNSPTLRQENEHREDSGSSAKSSRDQSYYSCRSSQEHSSQQQNPVRAGSFDRSDVRSIDMQRLSVFSADLGGIEPSSSSSSPSVAYSSVCMSPNSTPPATTFFV